MYTENYPSWDPQSSRDFLLLSPCAIVKRGREDRKSTYELVYWLDKTDLITRYPSVKTKRS
jgi:hypothetical protein